MPTGYTANIVNGISFKEFALDCMRAFGACVTLRDDPPGTPVPDAFEAGSYHLDRILENEEKLNEVRTMLLADAEWEAQAECEQTKSHLLEMINEVKANRESYQAMLDQAQAWTPPTPEHENFKKFMIEQITMSMKSDCNDEYYHRSLAELKPQSGMEWMDKKIESIKSSIEYHRKSYDREQEQAQKSTAWVRAIRDTLK